MYIPTGNLVGIFMNKSSLLTLLCVAIFLVFLDSLFGISQGILLYVIFKIILLGIIITYLVKVSSKTINKTASSIEIISDFILVFLVVFPCLLITVLNDFCIGWNEGSLHASCSISFLSGIYDFLMSMLLVAAFSGALFIFIPIAIAAFIISISCKIKNKRIFYRI
jgi:hypothetical protein